MTNKQQATPAPLSRAARPARRWHHWALAALFLAYMAFGWHYLQALMMLVSLEMLKPSVGLLMFAGTFFLAAGLARTLYDARLGKYCLLLAGAELAVAAVQIGNWDYKISRVMLATLAFGLAIALTGAWLAHRAGTRAASVGKRDN